METDQQSHTGKAPFTRGVIALSVLVLLLVIAGPAAAQSNLALNRPATQSSTYGGDESNWAASHATDGNLDPEFWNQKLSCTAYDVNAWWEIDLGSVQSLDHITIYQESRLWLNDFHVLVSDQPFTSHGLAATQAQSGVSDYPLSGNCGVSCTFSTARTGRYVRVQLGHDYHLGLAEVQVIGATTPPTVSLTAPGNNTSFSSGGNIALSATASDSDGSISKVEFYQGTTKLGEAASAPYTFSWVNVLAGSYSLTAKAFDNAGATTVSSPANIVVSDTGSQQWTLNGGTTNISNLNAGNVGIGTNGPSEKLEVVGNLKLTGSGNITATGTIQGGNVKAQYQDMAEWVPAAEPLSAGTVTILDPSQSNHVMASFRAYDARVAGVISPRPGIMLGEEGANKVLVATTGRVRVKVDATRGPIRIGDLLVTSNIKGFAMKSQSFQVSGVAMHRPGTLIGKALEPLAKGRGEILVLLSLQ